MNAPVRIKTLPHYASIADAVAAERPGVPLYLLHPKRFRAVAERFAAFPGDALYAVKANPSPQALEQVWAAGIRHFDTASLGEIELIKSRFPDAICHFMTPVRFPGAGIYLPTRSRERQEGAHLVHLRSSKTIEAALR